MWVVGILGHYTVRGDHLGCAWEALCPTGLTDVTASAYILQQPQENGKEKVNFNWIKHTKNISICSQYKRYNEMSVRGGPATFQWSAVTIWES